MKVFVLSKTRFDALMVKNEITNDNVEQKEKMFFISINDSCGTDAVPYFEEKENVKVLFFDDIEEDLKLPTKISGQFVIAKAFTEKQSVELFDFIEKHKDKESCIVHCTAGISRSGAIGTFINDFYGGDTEEFKKQNPYVLPNGLVLMLLKRAYRNKV